MDSINKSKDEQRNLNQIKTGCSISNINSKYILKKLFNYAQKRIMLEMIQYNKQLQNCKLSRCRNITIADQFSIHDAHTNPSIFCRTVKSTSTRPDAVTSLHTRMSIPVILSRRCNRNLRMQHLHPFLSVRKARAMVICFINLYMFYAFPLQNFLFNL